MHFSPCKRNIDEREVWWHDPTRENTSQPPKSFINRGASKPRSARVGTYNSLALSGLNYFSVQIV